jgi:hypothetical protein
VIARGPVAELVPVENAAMADRSVIQWDKDDMETLGLLKVDVLALGMLTAIRKAFALLQKHEGITLTMASVPQEDAATYDMLCRADSVGVFQVESRAQMSMLPRLRPRTFYDLVVQVAIVRPGPIQGGMVHPYLSAHGRSSAGHEEITYPRPEIEPVLRRTHGVPIFQEQVMQLAMVAAGFSPGEADQLRRAMGAWGRKGDLLTRYQDKLSRRHAGSRGYDPELCRSPGPSDPGLRQLRLSGVPRGQLRPAGVRIRLDQTLRARRLSVRPAQQPADGVLRPLPAHPGRPAPPGGSAARGRCRQQATGSAPWYALLSRSLRASRQPDWACA